MDDINAIAAAWCEEARGLSGPMATAPSMAMRRAGASGALTARLDAIGEGIRLRRRLDGLVPERRPNRGRRQVVCRLTELQRLAGEELAGLRAGTARHREVATRVKEWLVEVRVAVRNVLTVLQFEPLHQAMAIEGAARRPRMVEHRRGPARQRAPHAAGGLAGRRAGAAARLAGPAGRAAIPTRATSRSASAASG